MSSALWASAWSLGSLMRYKYTRPSIRWTQTAGGDVSLQSCKNVVTQTSSSRASNLHIKNSTNEQKCLPVSLASISHQQLPHISCSGWSVLAFPSIAVEISANHEPSHWSHDHHVQVSDSHRHVYYFCRQMQLSDCFITDVQNVALTLSRPTVALV